MLTSSRVSLEVQALVLGLLNAAPREFDAIHRVVDILLNLRVG